MRSNQSAVSSHSAAHVLIVDDDPDHLSEMVEYLSIRGIPSLAAYNVLEALEVIKRSAPSLVIMDVNMPQADGMDGAKMMRQASYDRPIILISGDIESVYSANIARLEIFAVLSKPVPMLALERHIRAVLAR